MKISRQSCSGTGCERSPQSGDRLMTLVDSHLVYMGETEYTRGTAQC